MTSKNILTAACLAMFILACGNNSTTDASEVSKIPPPAVDSPNSSVATNSGNGTTPVTGTSAGLNPAHGQPGHSCDIPVGSPLNSKPVQQPVVQKTEVVQSPVITQPNTTVPPLGNTTTEPGKNPPHGQPGHRCDITVGAPLNSKPTQTTATQGNTITLPSKTQITPAKPEMNSSKNQ